MRRKIFFVVLLSVLFVPRATFSQNKPNIKKAIAKCAALDSPLKRLDCFDGLAKSLEVDRPQVRIVQPTGTRKWIVRTSVSPIDDSRTVVLGLEAEGEFKGWLTKFRPTLILRCKEFEIGIYVVSGMVGNKGKLGGKTFVRYRLDKNPTKAELWNNSTDKKAIFYPGSPLKFIQELSSSRKLYIEIHPFNASPTGTYFSLRGLESSIVPLKKTCLASAQKKLNFKLKVYYPLAKSGNYIVDVDLE